MASLLHYVSVVIGWIYFAAWSFSFYPQLFHNYKRQKVDGLSVEFLFYNFTGFLFYTTFTAIQYVHQHHYSTTQSVRFNDIAFAGHALVLTLLTLVQWFIYPTDGQRPVNMCHILTCILIWISAGVVGILCSFGLCSFSGEGFSFISYLGYCKVFISVVKCIPQVILNYRTKSTSGWAIAQVLLDLLGGVGSISQQALDALDTGNWGFFTNNFPKFLLALQSIMGDSIFMTQHYLLYPAAEFHIYSVGRGSDPRMKEYDPLLTTV